MSKKQQPINIPLVKDGKKLSRSFDGKTEGFENKRERNFFTTMLKAYLKGFDRFVFGRDNMGKPKYHKVEQTYYYA